MAEQTDITLPAGKQAFHHPSPTNGHPASSRGSGAKWALLGVLSDEQTRAVLAAPPAALQTGRCLPAGEQAPPLDAKRPLEAMDVPSPVKWELLGVLSDEQTQAVLAGARRRRFKRGDVIFHEGDPGDTLHLLDRGHVAVRVTTPLGDTATLRVLGPGDTFGELSVVSPAPRNATVEALDDVQTLGLQRGHFDELRRAHPGIDRFLLEAVIVEVRRLSTQLLEAMYVPVPTRVYRRLVDLTMLYGPGGGPVVIPLTQDDLAGLCGTTRPTANKVLQELADQGVVDVGRGKISILDPDGLRRLGR